MGSHFVHKPSLRSVITPSPESAVFGLSPFIKCRPRSDLANKIIIIIIKKTHPESLILLLPNEHLDLGGAHFKLPPVVITLWTSLPFLIDAWCVCVRVCVCVCVALTLSETGE